MKKLFLLRHAEAASASADGDKTRPLSDKGLSDAKALGAVMNRRAYTPDIALCSSALRTRQTLEAVLESFGESDIHTEYLESLYNAPPENIFRAVRDTDDRFESILVIAHNPGIHQLSASLVSDGPQSLLARMMSGMPPARLNVFECPCGSWMEFEERKNKLTDMLDPLDYNAPASPARWT